jgi:hypothetical protein
MALIPGASSPSFDCENGVAVPQQQQQKLSGRDKVSITIAFGAALLIGFFVLGPTVQDALTDVQSKALTGPMTRREMLARTAAAGAAALGASQSANAKAGQFGKFDTRVWGLGFAPDGPEALSNPYFKGGGNKGGDKASFGYSKSDGAFLADGWKKDLNVEIAKLAEQEKIIRAQAARIETKEWFLARDDLREASYTMKKNMKRINTQCNDQKGAKKAYSAFVEAMNAADVAMRLKQQDSARTKFTAFLTSYDTWKSAVGV